MPKIIDPISTVTVGLQLNTRSLLKTRSLEEGFGSTAGYDPRMIAMNMICLFFTYCEVIFKALESVTKLAF